MNDCIVTFRNGDASGNTHACRNEGQQFRIEVVNLGTQRFPHHSDSTIVARIADDPAKFKLVAEMGGRIAGYGELETWPDRPRMRHGAENDMVATHPDFRGFGIGAALLGEMIDLADRWLQVTRLQLFVWEGNTRAMALYERFGFEKVGEFDFPVGNHRDLEFLMRLKLE